jgi:hypothetical protein
MSEQHHTQFCVYVHRRKDNNAIFYVGKGSYHRACNRSMRNRHWKFIEAKYGRTVEIVQWFDTEQEAFDHELFLIQSLRVFGAKLANVVDGGGGARGYKHTPSARQSMSQKRTGQPLSAHHRARVAEAQRREDVNEKRSASLRAYYSDEQAKQSVRATNAEINSRPEVRAKISQSLSAARRAAGRVRPVVCVTTGQKFESTIDAGAWVAEQSGKTPKQGSAAIIGAIKRCGTAYGYKWQYHNAVDGTSQL